MISDRAAISARKKTVLRTVPAKIRLFFFFGLIMQLLWHNYQAEYVFTTKELPIPPTQTTLTLLSAGETIATSRLLTLWLQVFDYQAGLSIPIGALDFDRLEAWLELILELDPNSHYPLLLASRIYSYAPDIKKKRQMIQFVRRMFIARPAQRWQWMAHTTLLAKHTLKDLSYALVLAKELRKKTTKDTTPDWARQMEIFILEDMGEHDRARDRIRALLQDDAFNNPQQLKRLGQRLLQHHH